MKKILSKTGGVIFTAWFFYQASRGLLTGEITIAGKVKSATFTGTTCLIASIGALILSIGSAWRLTDSENEEKKLFTLKSIPVWIGFAIIIIAIFMHPHP